MEDLFILLILASLFLFIVGFFSPSKSLFWFKGRRTKRKSTITYGSLALLFFVLFGLSTDLDENKEKTDLKKESSESSSSSLKKTVLSTAPAYKNFDSLKAKLIASPFGYNIKEESKWAANNAAASGDDPNKKDSYRNNTVSFQFDPRDRGIYSFTAQLWFEKSVVTADMANQAFQMAGLFDLEAEKYFRNHFDDIFINHETYLDSGVYVSKNQGLVISILTSFPKIERAIKRDGNKAWEGRLRDITLSVENTEKSLL